MLVKSDQSSCVKILLNVVTCCETLETKCGNICAFRIYYRWQQVWDLWPLCEKPACPDPVWKPVSYSRSRPLSGGRDAQLQLWEVSPAGRKGTARGDPTMKSLNKQVLGSLQVIFPKTRNSDRAIDHHLDPDSEQQTHTLARARPKQDRARTLIQVTFERLRSDLMHPLLRLPCFRADKTPLRALHWLSRRQSLPPPCFSGIDSERRSTWGGARLIRIVDCLLLHATSSKEQLTSVDCRFPLQQRQLRSDYGWGRDAH